jgi:hypothetical protein
LSLAPKTYSESGCPDRDGVKMSSIEDEAVSRKRKYPTINALITDHDLRLHVGRYETGASDVLLTFGTALLRDHHPAPLPAAGLLASLENNLSVFIPGLCPEKQRDISANLLNGRIQFLNTLSELGLARYYVKLGWCVRLAEPLPTGPKDVDLFMSLGADVRWLDVVNAAPNEWEGDGFVPPIPDDFEMRLVDKVVQKFTSKFQAAIDVGWTGAPWVALDFTKNDGIARGVTVLGLIGLHKLKDFADEVLRRCPDLAGVVYFTYHATETEARWVREWPRF